VTKNAMMMIDFALAAERAQGLAPLDAIRQGCLLRFRPIMMTTMSALFGAIPLASGVGVGSELRTPLGIAIIGGLIASQVLTLYATPVIYPWFARWALALGEKEARQQPATHGREDVGHAGAIVAGELREEIGARPCAPHGRLVAERNDQLLPARLHPQGPLADLVLIDSEHRRERCPRLA